MYILSYPRTKITVNPSSSDVLHHGPYLQLGFKMLAFASLICSFFHSCKKFTHQITKQEKSTQKLPNIVYVLTNLQHRYNLRVNKNGSQAIFVDHSR